MRTKLFPSSFTALLIIIFLNGCSITRALRIEDRKSVDVRTMIDEVSSVPVVFVGERHNATEHHRIQLEVLKGLKSKGKILAIGMEMFEGSSQKELDAWTAGTLTTNEFVAIYQLNWRNIPYWYYADIFSYARDNQIPIIALNASREMVGRVARAGLSCLTDVDRKVLPPGADAEVSEDYLLFIRSSYGVHDKNDVHFRNICEAQMLRNRVMASRIRTYRELHPESVVVVLAGGGHAREKGGIPAELGNLPFKVILPLIPGVSAESVRRTDAHFLMDEPFSLLDFL